MSAWQYALAGAAEGFGNSLVEEAHAERERGLKILEEQGAFRKSKFAHDLRMQEINQQFQNQKELKNLTTQQSQQQKQQQLQGILDLAKQNGWDEVGSYVQSTQDIAGAQKMIQDRMKLPETPKPTTLERNYALAKEQGFEGSFMDYQTALKKAGATNVTVNPESDFKVPSGYMRDPNDPTAVVAIPGGPAQKVAAETAGRLGLAQDSVKQLDKVMQSAQRGDLSGLGDYITGSLLGHGDQGAKVRELMAASESITRLLTGAGMNESEAAREVSLYLPKITDDAATVTSKVQQLKRRLRTIITLTERGTKGPDNRNSTDDPLGIF